MKKLLFLIAIGLADNVQAQLITFKFQVYTTFSCSGREYFNLDILTAPDFEFTGIGLGDNRITFDLEHKVLKNDYDVSEDYTGTLVYDSIRNYTCINGIVTFSASRYDPGSREYYTEHFVIDKNTLTAKENKPYFISYWYNEDGTVSGTVVNRDVVLLSNDIGSNEHN
jgi:hypothetical protein